MIAGGGIHRKDTDRNIANSDLNNDCLQRAKRRRISGSNQVDRTRDSLLRLGASAPPMLPGVGETKLDTLAARRISIQKQPTKGFRQRRPGIGPVRFATPIVSLSIPHIVYADEIDSNWYSRSELETIEKQCMETIRLVQSGKLICDDDHVVHCRRGLESRTHIENETQHHHREGAQLASPAISSSKSKEDIISAVLDAQIDMWSSGITSLNDQQYQLERVLAETYTAHSSHHVFKAIVRALYDWRAVHDFKSAASTSTGSTRDKVSTASLVNELARIASATAANRPSSIFEQDYSLFSK